jgi:general secretion pathway protein D
MLFDYMKTALGVALWLFFYPWAFPAEQAATGGREREQSRDQLLDEVGKGWQRPGLAVEPGPDAVADAKVAPLAQKLERIILPTVNFNRVDLGRVVTTLSAASEEFDATGGLPKGINIVLLDPGKKAPTVSITLRNLSLKRVLDFVVDSVGYQYEIQADAVVVRPGGENTSLETAYFPVTQATVIRMSGTGSGGNPSIAAPKNGGLLAGNEGMALRRFLQDAGVNFETTSGSSLAYDGSGVFVTQTARNLERIRAILARYHGVRQVEIEAKFMEVQEGVLDEIGVKWTVAHGQSQVYTTDNINRTLNEAFSNSSTARSLTVVSPQVTTTTNGGSTSSPSTTTETSGGINLSIPVSPATIPGGVSLGAADAALATINAAVGEFDVNAIVRALSQRQGTDLLSSPKVTVLSGNPANIVVAQEMRFPQSYGAIQSQVGTGNAAGGGSAGVSITSGTPQEFTTRNVGVELKVTPTVEEDDHSISLDLNPKVTEFDGFVEYGGPSIAISGGTTVTVPPGFYQPIFSVREVSTKVTIWDGATLVMGGLTREEVKKVNDKVPILGDIPLLGRLFKSKGESSQKRNLLIFVTANLVSPGGSLKKQTIPDVPAGSLFQNPTVVTPAGVQSRGGAK